MVHLGVRRFYQKWFAASSVNAWTARSASLRALDWLNRTHRSPVEGDSHSRRDGENIEVKVGEEHQQALQICTAARRVRGEGMTEQSMTERAIGPIDYLALELPAVRMKGEGLAAIVDLVDRGIIRGSWT